MVRTTLRLKLSVGNERKLYGLFLNILLKDDKSNLADWGSMVSISICFVNAAYFRGKILPTLIYLYISLGYNVYVVEFHVILTVALRKLK